MNDNRVKIGIPGLDDILNGGLPATHLYLMEGDPGTGKTTIALQFLQEGVKEHETALYVTLSESRQELLAVAESHGWSLDGIDIFELLPEENSLRVDRQYTVFHPAEVELADTTRAILDRVEGCSARRVVIDSLSELRMLAQEPIRYRRQLLALKQYFSDKNCTVLLLDDRTTERTRSPASQRSSRRDLARKPAPGIRDQAPQDADHQASWLLPFARDITTTASSAAESRSTRAWWPQSISPVSGRGGHQPGSRTRHAFRRRSSSRHQYPGLRSGRKREIHHLRRTMRLRPRSAGNPPPSTSSTREFVPLCPRLARLGMDPETHIRSGLLRVEQIDPAEMSPGEFVSRVRDDVSSRNCRLLVIDSLNGFTNSMPGEHYLPMQLHELISYLNQQGLVTLLVFAQHGLISNDLVSVVDISYLADAVLLLRYFETDGEVKLAISVVKNRSGRHEKTIRVLSLDERITIGNPVSGYRQVLSGVSETLGSPGDCTYNRTDGH